MRALSRALAVFVFGAVAAGCSGDKRAETTTTEQAALSVTQQKLQAADGAANDVFGDAVALTDSTAFVAAPQDDNGAIVDQGSVYAFARTGSQFSQSQKLTASDGAASDLFGNALAASASTLLVGAASDNVGSIVNAGSVYAFSFTGSSWAEQQRFSATDASAQASFGFSVAISGDTAFVSALGGIYVFARSAGIWTQTQKITRPGRAFIAHLAASGDTLLAGMGCDPDDTVTCLGAAFVYVRSGSSFVEQQKLVPPVRAAGDVFGTAVALEGNTALIGAPDANFGAASNPGAAYVFVRSGSVWTLQQKLVASDGRAEDRGGTSVALLGNIAVLGAPGHEHNGQNTNHGSAYLFVRSGSTWSEDQELRAADNQNGDAFGSTSALAGGLVLVGAPRDDGPFVAQGSAYVFSFSGSNGQSCSLGSQCASGFCSDGRCCNTACSGVCDACSVAAGAAHDGECGFVSGSAPASAACAPLTCNGSGATCAQCASDADCSAGKYCDPSGACQTQKTTGRACEPADCKTPGCRVCASGNCVDGFCCNEACNGGCRSCIGAITGLANGTCSPVLAGTDPKNACAADPSFPDSCGADGTCNGSGACRSVAPEGTACGDLTCSAGTVRDFACNGSGQCIASTFQCSGGGSGGTGGGGSGGSGGTGGTGGGTGGSGGSGGGGGSAQACIRVAPNGDDALGAASSGASPFRNIQPAIDFAFANPSVASEVCVAAGATCGSATTYASPAGDLRMRNRVSVLGRFESSTWTRCGSSTTDISTDGATGIVFGSDIVETTTLDGFGILFRREGSGVTVNGARGAALVDLAIEPLEGNLLAQRSFGVDVLNGGDVTITSTDILTSPSAIEAAGIRSTQGRVVFQDGSIHVRGDSGPETGFSIYGVWLIESPASRVERSDLTLEAGTHLGASLSGIAAQGDSQGTQIADNVISQSLSAQGFPNLPGPAGVGISFTGCSGTALGIARNTLSGPLIGISVASDCSAAIDGNHVAAVGAHDTTSVGIQAGEGSSVTGNVVKASNNAGGVTASGSRNFGVGVRCFNCTEVSRNAITGLSSVACMRNCLYGAVGLAVEAEGTTTLVDANSILGGCSGGPFGGFGSFGISAAGTVRIQNNVVFAGGDCSGRSDDQSSSTAHALDLGPGDVDVHSNYLDGTGTANSVCDSSAIHIEGSGSRIRNNILVAGRCLQGANVEEVDTNTDPVLLENNAFVPGVAILYRDQGTVDPKTAEEVNALADIVSRNNFSATCPLPLAAGSPCVDRGTPDGAPDHDIDGDPRSATFPDTGPDEFGDLPH